MSIVGLADMPDARRPDVQPTTGLKPPQHIALQVIEGQGKAWSKAHISPQAEQVLKLGHQLQADRYHILMDNTPAQSAR